MLLYLLFMSFFVKELYHSIVLLSVYEYLVYSYYFKNFFEFEYLNLNILSLLFLFLFSISNYFFFLNIFSISITFSWLFLIGPKFHDPPILLSASKI